MEGLITIQEKQGQAQEKRVAKALLEGPEYRWSKGPLGWTCSTPSGGCYLVTERGECSCMDHLKNCAGRELRCKHVTALRFKLAGEQEAAPAPKRLPAMSEAEAARFDSLYA